MENNFVVGSNCLDLKKYLETEGFINSKAPETNDNREIYFRLNSDLLGECEGVVVSFYDESYKITEIRHHLGVGIFSSHDVTRNPRASQASLTQASDVSIKIN